MTCPRSSSHFTAKFVIKSFLDTYGDLPVERLTPEFLSSYQRQALKNGSSNSTVNRKTEVLTAILNYSVKHRRIPFNPSMGFKKLARPQTEMAFWSMTEAQSFLNYVDSKYPRHSDTRWIYIVYLLALNSGIRAGEIWGLLPSDLDARGNTISVKRQFHRVSLKFEIPKGKKPRKVPSNPELSEELTVWIRQKKISPDETIFMNRERKPACHDNFEARQFAKDMKGWGGRQIRFHDFRHTAATLLIASGVDLKTVKEICGHNNIQTTMGYAHLVSGAIEKVANSFSVSPTVREVPRI